MLNRRDFLKLAATLSAAFGITGLPEPVLAALKKIDPQAIPKLIYLQGQSCTGCSISLLQANEPSPLVMITDYSQLVFHADLVGASGPLAMEMIEKYLSGGAGEYFLALEGSIPANMPDACKIGATTYLFATAMNACVHISPILLPNQLLDGRITVAQLFIPGQDE